MSWYILYTRYYHERSVYKRLQQKGFEVYLPVTMISRPSKREVRQVPTPLFPRYVFVRCYLEMYAHLELITLPGVLRLLESTRGRFLEVPEDEMRLLQQLGGVESSLERAAYPLEGEWMQVVRGPWLGIVGVVCKGSPGTLFVPIPSLHASIAVNIGDAPVTPYTDVQKQSSPKHSSEN